MLDLTGSYTTEKDSPQLLALCKRLHKQGVMVNGLVPWDRFLICRM